jgi:hypothetical protein
VAFGRLLDRSMSFQRLWPICVVALGLVPGVVALWAIWQITPDGLSPVTQKLPTWDFTNLWAGGVLAAAGKSALLFDHDAYSAWLRAYFNLPLADHEWSYPPSLLLLGVPLSCLPLYGSYLVWTGGTLALLWGALRWGRLPLAACLMALASPGVLNNMAFGQNGALTAALLVGGMLLVERRPIVAGVLMGLLTMKPHLGILLPVCVIAAQNGRTLLAAALTALALIVVTALAFGWAVWPRFISETEPLMRAILEAPWPTGFQVNAVSLFMLARALGAALYLAYAVQVAATLAAAAIVWRAWRLPAVDPIARAALTICLGLLATPYAFSYDLVAYSVAVAALIARGGWRFTPFETLAWLWPGVTHAVTQKLALPLTPLIVAATAWFAWQQLRPASAPKPGAASWGLRPSP